MLDHIVSGDVIVLPVIRGRPFTFRIASICSSGSDAKMALPTPDACNGARLPSLTIVRIISRHCTWSTNTASVPSRIARFAVSPDCSIRRRMYTWLCATKSRLARNVEPTANACSPTCQRLASPVW